MCSRKWDRKEKMADFTVSAVVDGDIFEVKNGWEWKEKRKKVDTVRPTGYNTPEEASPDTKKQNKN